MAPSKANVESVSRSRKEEEEEHKEQEEDEELSRVSSSLGSLSLKPRHDKDVADLEAHLARIQLTLDAPTKNFDKPKKKSKEEGNEEKETVIIRTEKTEEKEEKIEKKKDDKIVEEKTKDELEVKKEKEEEKKEEEEEEEKDEKEKGVKESKEEKKEIDDAAKFTRIGVEDKEKKDEEEKEEEEEEEEVSDDENPPDEEDVQRIQPQTKYRSRGLVQGLDHSHGLAPHGDYLSGMSGHQQYQQQHQQHLQHQQQQPGQRYPIMWSPQHGQLATYPDSASPEWCGDALLDPDSGNTFIPSFEEYSPESCSSVKREGSNVDFGFGAESPQSDEDSLYSQSPHYAESQPSPYQEAEQAGVSQYSDNLPSPCQQQSNHQYVDNHFINYQSSLSHSSYQPGIPQYMDNHASFYQFSQSPSYQQYRDNQASSFHQGSVNVFHSQAMPQMYSQQQYQDIPYSPQMPFVSASRSARGIQQSPVLTPPTSPQSQTLSQEEDIAEIITSYTEDKHFQLSAPDSKIIEITQYLMNLGRCSQSSLEEHLNQEYYDIHYKACAKMTNEELVQPDPDGDNIYLRAGCSNQTSNDYKERLVAYTSRVENVNLCCDTVVNWRDNTCSVCQQSDARLFYSPLSWKNKKDEMMLSNLVLLMSPVPVVQYMTKKVMQRPIDMQRTFSTHYHIFHSRKQYYPCLLEGLRMLE